MASETVSPQSDSNTTLEPAALYLDEKNRFEAAKTCYQQQATVLATMTKVDMQIINGYLAIQLLVTGWTAKEPVGSIGVRIGLSLIEVVLTMVAFGLLRNSKMRRGEVSLVVRKLNIVLGYSVEGAFLKGDIVQPFFDTHYWFSWFIAAMIGSLLGIGCIVWWPR